MIESQLYSHSATSYKKNLQRVIVTTIIIVTTILFLKTPYMQRILFYPNPYKTTVEKYCREYNVDKNLATSIIKNESNFNNKAKSHVGAIGLMQLMPATAEWLSFKLNDKTFQASELNSVNTNLRYGIYYLSELNQEFNNNEVLTIAAYNAGSGTVHHWIEKYHWSDNFSEVDSIPYPETRMFVKKVIQCKKKYNELY